MGMAMAGLTHCKKCWKPLKDDEYYMCKNCEIEEKTKMNKVFKGYELIKEIAEGNIKERNKIKR